MGITKSFTKSISRFYSYSGLAYLKQLLCTSSEKNAVFIWIPKTAGTSLYHMLGKPPKLKNLFLVKHQFVNKGLVTFGHMKYSELVRRDFISNDYDHSSFKFAFTRNPYDRAVSLYFHFKSRRRLISNETFLDFCRRLEVDGCEKIGLYNVKGFSQCNPQVRWVEDVNVDFLGKMEQLEDDCEKLFNILGIQSASIPHLNKSAVNNYKKYYCDESKEIIEEFYKEDFLYFSYKMKD